MSCALHWYEICYGLSKETRRTNLHKIDYFKVNPAAFEKYLHHFGHAKEVLRLSLKPDQTKKAANDVSRAQPANVPAAVTRQPKAPNAVEKKGRIGAKIRKTYTIDFKLKAIKLVEEAKKRTSKKKNPIQYVANKMKVNKSLI